MCNLISSFALRSSTKQTWVLQYMVSCLPDPDQYPLALVFVVLAQVSVGQLTGAETFKNPFYI